MATNRAWRRRRYFVRGSLQPRLIFKTLVLVLVLIVIGGLVFYLLANKQLSWEYYRAHSTLRQVMDLLLPWLIAANVLGLAITMTLALFASHSVAGPLYRLEQELHRIAEGDLTLRTGIRPGDDPKELARAISHLNQTLDQKISRVRQDFDQLSTSVGRFGADPGLSRALGPDGQELMIRIRQQLETVQEGLRYFRTSSSPS